MHVAASLLSSEKMWCADSSAVQPPMSQKISSLYEISGLVTQRAVPSTLALHDTHVRKAGADWRKECHTTGLQSQHCCNG